MTERYTDEKIIDALRGPDKKEEEKVLKYLYRKCWPMAVKMVKKYEGTYAEAKDVFHEAMVGLYESIKSNRFRGESTVETYLLAIVKHIWFSYFKQRNKWVELPEMTYEESSLDKKLDSEILKIPEDIDEEAKKLLVKAFAQLGKRCREILQLYYYERLDMEEIARLTGLKNANSAKTQKYKCIKKLSKIIEKNPELKTKLKAIL